MEVCEKECEVSFKQECTMKQNPILVTQTRLMRREILLKRCTFNESRQVRAYTVYNCKNITKTQCTTLWDRNEFRRSRWIQIGGGCTNVTQKQCIPNIKKVSVFVPFSDCVDHPVQYIELVNSTINMSISSSICKVVPISICRTVNRSRCAAIFIPKCANIAVTTCKPVAYFRPSQPQILQQWCQINSDKTIEVIPLKINNFERNLNVSDQMPLNPELLDKKLSKENEYQVEVFSTDQEHDALREPYVNKLEGSKLFLSKKNQNSFFFHN